MRATVGFLLLITGALLAWVAAGTLRASRDATVRAGLDYEAFLEAVDDLIEGAGGSTLLRFDEVEARLAGGRSVTYDTLAILADGQAFPAFQQAGFLYDQVQAYNRFQRERLDLSRFDPSWWDRLKAFNPSIFRMARNPDGTAALARAPAAWSLRVRSPLEGDWEGEVRARDVVRGVGLLGPRLSLPLRKPARLDVRVENRRQPCEFVPSSPEVRIYCLSEERIAQARLLLPAEGDRGRWAVAGWADLWMDGRRIRSGDSVQIREGALLRLEPLEPLVFNDLWEGVLSSKQWVNGRMRRRSDLQPPLDLFETLGSGPVDARGRTSSDAYVTLSVNSEASADLTARLANFLETRVDLPLELGAAVIARVPDGEILAVAEVGERKNRGRSTLLERVAPGSAVKPLLAAAILSRRPELSGLETPARSGSVSSVLGMPGVAEGRAFTTALNCSPPREGTVDLRYFLRCSNNEYAATLLVAGLSESGVPGAGWRGAAELSLQGRMVPRTVLLRSPLSEGLSDLFDVPTDPAIADARGRSRRIWEGLTFSDGTPFSVPYEVLPSESRPALLAPGSPEGTDLSLLYRYAYGAWENQWTLLDLTNSFARVATDRRIQLRFSKMMDPGSPPAPDTLGLGRQGWYPEFLAGLGAVAVDGTARDLRSSWREQGLPSMVLAKTGTLNEAGEPTPSDDLFAKSLLFAVGNPGAGAGGAMACGLVGGVYLRFARGPGSGNLPSYQVEFARQALGEFLRLYWEEFGACPEGGI